ncbi:MAG: hypothetical protein ABEH47_07575 [Haloferacaceae archaeon]
MDGQVLLLAGAKASVAPTRLPDLVDRAAAYLDDRRDRYRRDYERVHADADRAVYLVETGHWDDVGEALGLSDREVDALRRVHAEQLRRVGRRTDRREEFDHALDVREAVVVGRET